MKIHEQAAAIRQLLVVCCHLKTWKITPTQNEKTLHADLILAGITQLITIVLVDKIHHHEFIRSLKLLVT